MKFARAAQVIGALPNKQSVLLLGPPGIGKTALARMVGAQMAKDTGGAVYTDDEGVLADKALDERDKKVMAIFEEVFKDLLAKNPPKVEDDKKALRLVAEAEAQKKVPPVTVIEVRDLCSHLPEDLLGLPWRDGERTQYCPPTWLARLSRKGVQGVLVLDDLAAASPAVQVAAFKLVLERRSGDCAISPNVKLVATANRREDKSGATMLPAALRNRCYIETLDVDAEAWCEWAAQQKLHGDVPAFMRWKQAHLSHLPKDADERGAFATPRTWEMLARALPAAKATDSVVDVASGLVGNGVATEFAAFVQLREALPDPRAVLENPEQAMPTPPPGTQPDKIIAVCTAIAECAAPLSVDKKHAAELPYKFMHALCHVSSGGREYAAAGILTYAANGGQVASLIKCARDGRADPRFKDLLKHLKAGLLPQGSLGG
jgi:MoxR-like ATPase